MKTLTLRLDEALYAKSIRSTFIPTAQVNTLKAVSGALSRTLSKVLAAPVG